MNLKNLFETQKQLMERIEKEHPTQPGENRRNKKILALIVEVSECLQEWRGFKFWSNNQQPNFSKRIKCPTCEGNGYHDGFNVCPDCDNPRGGIKTVYPLIEEFVDGLHFVLELGLDTNIDLTKFYDWEFPESKEDVNEAFLQVFEDIQAFKELYIFCNLLESYIRLGAAFGFAWEDIEQAYYKKNQINFQRQDNGY